MRLTVCVILYLLSHLAQGQNCAPGRWWNGSACVPCPRGTYCPGGNPAPKIKCTAGTFQSGTGQSSCIPCNVGTFSAVDSAINCAECPAGQYQPDPGQTSCLSCAVGSYQSETGQASCLECDAGTYQPGTGASSCINCAAGTYQPNLGTTACIDCAAGTYQPSQGATSCIECAAGSHQPDSGTISCILCPAGTYQNLTGQANCINCPINTNSLEGSDDISDCNIIITPVRLVDFQAKSFARGVWLTWETSQETNSAFFAIERSQNGRDYRMIGQLKAAGNYNGSTHYYFTDSVPAAGANYYRLRQVDLDGKYWISPVRQVNFISKSGVQIYPNPVRTQVLISHPTEIIEQVAFYGQNGAQMMRLLVGVRTQTVDLSKLAPGLYMMEVMVGGKRYMEKVIKQ